MVLSSQALTEAHLWAALSAPVCALFAVRNASQLVVAGGSRDAPLEPVDWRLAAPLAAGAIFVAAWSAPSSREAIGNILFLSGLCHLAIVDLRWLAVPVRSCLVLIAAGIAFAFLDARTTGALMSAAAAFSGWASYRLLDLLYLRLRGRMGLGSGDALVAGAIGAWLGFQGLAWCTALGGAATLFAAVRHANADTQRPMAFVPGLALAAFVVLLFEQWA